MNIKKSPRQIIRGAIAGGATLAMLASTILPLHADERDENLKRINHIIVIYQENWSFDSLYGQFPGADGLANGFDTLPQVDKSTGYSNLVYQTPSPLTGFPLAIDPQFPSVNGSLALWSNPALPLPLMPYDFTRYVASNSLTGDIVHRFYHEQLQIDNGALEAKKGDMDKFVTWSDNPGLVLSYIDATVLPEGRLAQQFTICDKFFHSAYGGSFLNHQWLIAAASPPWTAAIPSGFISSYDPVNRVLKDNQLTIDGKYAVNTTQPLLAPFSPGTVVAKRLLINNTDPSAPGFTPTIGNRLDDAGINWRWYSGGWNDALANNVTANGELFQFHHQPFAYYTKYAPFLSAPTSNYSTGAPPQLNPATTGPDAHLQDEQNFFTDVASGNLPPVTFIKPLGPNNEHPGYTDEVTGQKHVAELVAAVQNSKLWKDSVIIITYDENGGRWDHVVPPVRPDGWGVGTRVPGIVISPFTKGGFIDDNEYETVSILKLIERRYHLAPLSDRDLNPNVSDLTSVFHFD
ncbi:MAG TPA: alkaline phosphatase family protein [Verrucomicrobiae bacterium]|nr:alkaline phosphatase family protein [Verrucomicrobiae bacterium]